MTEPPVPPTPEEMGAAQYPGARRPDRRRTVDAAGVAISVVEWGDPDAPPLAIAHGGFDFAETLDVFAPMLADGGWRVVSWDQRGHGDSAWAHLYSWEADLRDAAAVIASLPPEPLPFVGHSKGGSLMMHLPNMAPHRISALVNLDGLPSSGTVASVPQAASASAERPGSPGRHCWNASGAATRRGSNPAGGNQTATLGIPSAMAKSLNLNWQVQRASAPVIPMMRRCNC